MGRPTLTGTDVIVPLLPDVDTLATRDTLTAIWRSQLSVYSDMRGDPSTHMSSRSRGPQVFTYLSCITNYETVLTTCNILTPPTELTYLYAL